MGKDLKFYILKRINHLAVWLSDWSQNKIDKINSKNWVKGYNEWKNR